MRLLTMLLISVVLVAATAFAQIPTGTWTLEPSQATSYSVQVQPPINADSSSSFKSGRGVIPVKFSLFAAPGPVVFESLLSGNPAYSALSFSPTSPLTFSQILTLTANFTLASGETCHGGSPRWTIGTASHTVWIYYYNPNAPGPCAGTDQNIIGLSDAVYEIQGSGAPMYRSYADTASVVGSEAVQYVALVVDGGWGGDQILTLNGASVNGNTWTATATGSPTQTCALPPATIQVTKTGDSTPLSVDEAASIQPNDTNGQFRVSNCQYVYNLANTLPVGSYKVEVIIPGKTVDGFGAFGVK